MGLEQLRADQLRWNAMFGGNNRTASRATSRNTRPPQRVSVALRTRLQREFGIGCTSCFNATLAQLDKLSIDEIRRESSNFANALRENAHEMEAVKRRTDGRKLVEWAKANGNGDSATAYERLIIEACEACEQRNNTDPAVIAKMTEHFAAFMANAKPSFDIGSGRGIVTLGGGRKYFICSYVLIRLLRTLGCELPIEWVYLDDSEVTQQMRDIMAAQPDVDAVDLSSRCKPRISGGWNAKVWSVITSRFREVLFLDADQLPIRDPAYLFDDPQYLNAGSVLWADIPNANGLDITADAFRVMGLDVPGNSFMPSHNKPSDYRPVESGQLLFDKSRCGKALEVCREMNDHSDFFYPMPRGSGHWHLYGDKSTFYLAWEATRTPYAKPNYPAWQGVNGNGAFLQFDLSGVPIFQHKCQPPSKWDLSVKQTHAPGIYHLDLVDQFLDELRGTL